MGLIDLIKAGVQKLLTPQGNFPIDIKLQSKTLTTNYYILVMDKDPNYLLGANASVATTAFDAVSLGVKRVALLTYSDVASATDGVQIQQSTDGVNWDYASKFTASAGAGLAASVEIIARYVRFYYLNGATAQTVWRLQLIFSP